MSMREEGAMAKKRTLAEDKGVLEKKVRERRAASQNPEGEKDVRRLRKRLKRVHRKIRSQTARVAKAAVPSKAA